MASLVDANFKPVSIPDDQVAKAYLAGRVKLPSGQDVPVTGPDGTPGYVPVKLAHLYFDQGYQYAPQEVQKAELEDKYGGALEGMKAAGEGFASGMTFGTSRLAERALGIKPEDMAGRKKVWPWTSTGSEIVGAVAPSFIAEIYSGGTATPGVIANAARIASAPVRAVSALGEGAAQAVMPHATGALARALAAGVSGAIQGPAYGAGQLVSEAAMGDPQLNAEHVLTTLGLSAVVGGVTGAGVSLLGDTAKAVYPKALPQGLGPQELEDFAGERAAMSARPIKGAVKEAQGMPGGMQAIGKDWLDKGIAGGLKTADQSAELADAAMNKIGPEIGNIYRDLDLFVSQNPQAASFPDGGKFFNAVKQKVQAEFSGQHFYDSAVKSVSNTIDEYATDYAGQQLSNAGLWGAIKDFGAQANWKGIRTQTESYADDVIKTAWVAMKDELQGAATTTTKILGLPDAGAKIAQLNADYTSMKLARAWFAAKAAAEASNHTFGILDLLTGGAAAMAAGPMGLVGVVGSKMLRKFGNGLAASAAYSFAGIERAINANNSRIGQAITTVFAPNMQQAVARAVPTVAFPMFNALNEEKPKDRLDAFKMQRRDLQRIQANPQVLVDNLTKSTEGVSDVAPAMTTAMQTSASQIVQALNAAMPKDPSQNPTNPMKQEWQPSETELGKWQRVVRTAQDPLATTVEALSRNIYDPVAWDFLKQAYPSLYTEIQRQAMVKLTEHGAEVKKGLPLAKRIQLSQAFGFGDDALSPASIQLSQQAFVQAAQQMEQQQPVKKGAPGKKEKETYSLATTTQRLEAR